MTLPMLMLGFTVVFRPAKRSLLKLLFAILLLASCQADQTVTMISPLTPKAVNVSPNSTSRASPSPPTPFLEFSPVQGNIVIGEMISLQDNRIVVRDAEGLHLINGSSKTQIYKATGKPVPQIQEIRFEDLAPPQVLWITGGASTDESFNAVRIDVNYFLGRAGIIEKIDSNLITARLQKSGKSSEAFEDKVSVLWISPSTRIQTIRDGVPTLGKLGEAQPGARMILDGYKAEDGSIVVANLLFNSQ